MDQQKLTKLLHLQEKEIAGATPFCPSGYEAAALFESTRDDRDYESFERHLSDCSYCHARTVVLARLHRNGDDEQIPDDLLAAADKFGNQPRRYHFRRAPAWAAAAVVVIALFVIVGRSPNPGSGAIDQPPLTDVNDEPVRVLRNIGPIDSGLTILAPIDGERIRRDELMVRWTQVPGSLYYDVRLVNAAGFIIWQDRVKNTQSNLPPDLELVSGDRYFIRVDAYLAEAKSISSLHVKFIAESDN
jgi:hypothetical protein